MKWLKIIIDLAKDLIPLWGKIRKDDLADELEIVLGALKIATSNDDDTGRARLIIEAAGNLKAVKKFKKRISNKIDKAGVRLVKKFL